MKILRSILSGMFIFLCLFCSCAGGIDSEGSTPLEEEGIEEETENPDDEEEDKEDEEETEDESGEILPAPVFLRYKTLPENEIVFEFSQQVSFVSLKFNPEQGFKVIGEGNEVKIKLTENTEPGLAVEADLLVKDSNENTVSAHINFRARNGRVPELQINELRTQYSKPSAEFIEFKMLSDGNLGALRVFVAGNYKNPLLYEFAPVEVKKGEFVVLHLRTTEDLCKDEYGDNKEESGGKDSSPTARDLWIPGSSKLLHKTDAVYVLDQDDNVLDAVMIAETPSPSWNKDYFTKAAELLFSKGAWKSPTGTVCSPADAVSSSEIKTAMTKSISRREYETPENTHTEADWYVTKAGNATPGLPNKE
jgi:hypothetical protein